MGIPRRGCGYLRAGGHRALALPWIMPGVASIQTAYTVYLLNTISTLSGYFLVTRAADVHLHPAGVPVYPHRLLL